MLSLLIDNTASRSSSSRCAIPERVAPTSSSKPARGPLPAGATAEAGDVYRSFSKGCVTGTHYPRGRLLSQADLPTASAGASAVAASPFYSPWTVRHGKRV